MGGSYALEVPPVRDGRLFRFRAFERQAKQREVIGCRDDVRCRRSVLPSRGAIELGQQRIGVVLVTRAVEGERERQRDVEPCGAACFA